MILVTGAAGLSGSIIVREFAKQQIQAKALVRSRSKAAWIKELPSLQLVEGDMGQPGTLGGALRGVDRVLMLSSSDERMVETQCTFIEACRQAGVKHVVKMSGKESAVGFDPERFRFTRMHNQIEDYLEESGISWTHLRPSQFMQVYFREVATIVAENAFFLPMEEARLAPIDIEDIAKIAASVFLSAGHEAKSYDMTGPEVLTMAQIADYISAAIGKTVRYVNVTPEEKRRALVEAGMPRERADAMDELFAERRRNPESQVNLNPHRTFGIHPTTFAEFAHRNAHVFRGRT
jgi:uncharacterized protein YbjT (DUF2867 family)